MSAKTQQIELQPKQETAIEPVKPAPVSPYIAMLEMAVGRGDVAAIEKLIELKYRDDDRQAKGAFHAAMNAFKAKPPVIEKNKTVDYTTEKGRRVKYDHPTLGHACERIIEALSKHGISHRWKIDQSAPGNIRVTCILTHELGHSEETTLCAGPDDSGNKNAIQALSSTVSYLERYTLLAATGLAADDDDDARSAGTPKMEKLNEYVEAIGAAPNMTALEGLFREAYKEAQALKNLGAQKILVAAKDAKKKALTGSAA